jgi:hypothetical protein
MLDTEFATVAVYDVVPVANVGESVADDPSVRLDAVATELAARATANE